MHTDDLEFEWDPVKDRTNQRKHGIRFADAVMVFEDTQAVLLDDEHPSERRFVAIGTEASGEILVVVFTWRNERIRLISARKADAWEKQLYEKGE